MFVRISLARRAGRAFAFAALLPSSLHAQTRAVALPADDEFGARLWAGELFFAERGILLDSNVTEAEIAAAPLRAMQLEYERVQGRSTILLLWREAAGDPEGAVAIEQDGARIGEVPSLAAAARPGVNFALVQNVAPSSADKPAFRFRAARSSGAVAIGEAVQSALLVYPMGVSFEPQCQTRVPGPDLCLMEICWTNPGPPASGFAWTVDGEFQSYREEVAPGVANAEELSLQYRGDYAVRVMSVILAEDPDVFRNAAGPDGLSFSSSGAFLGRPRDLVCAVPCGLEPPPRFQRGVCGAEGLAGIPSVIAALRFLFLGGEAPPCLAACDANGDGSLDIADPLLVLFERFASGPAPPGWRDLDGDGRPDPTCVSATSEERCGRSQPGCL